MRTLLLSLCVTLLAGSAPTLTMAQTTTTTTTTSAAATAAPTTTADTSTQAQQAAIQTEITQGIMNGTLTQDQIGALQAQQDRLTSARAAAAGGGANGPSYNTEGRTSTGPDPFTYNTLGPDAYQSQKYQNPQYNVPAYPTTNSTSLNTTQQYNQGAATGPASATPQVGTYYGNNGVNTGGSGGVATPNGNGVYVYQTGIGKGR